MTEAPCVDATCSVDCSTSTGELHERVYVPTGNAGSGALIGPLASPEFTASVGVWSIPCRYDHRHKAPTTGARILPKTQEQISGSSGTAAVPTVVKVPEMSSGFPIASEGLSQEL
jgi:hypothetical protein